MNATPSPAANPTPCSGAPSPLLLLVRIALLSSWRRLLALREQSWFLLGVIGTFLVGYLGLAFTLFYLGLRFISKFPGLGGLLVERLLFVLFAFLFSLLLISNLVISYTNLFKNRETTYLLALPVPTRTIFQWKLVESTLLASWAFIFLIAPLLCAYGLVNRVDWHFYPMVLVLLSLFIVLPGVLGAWGAVTLARFLDRKAFQVLVVTGLLALIGLMIFQFRPQPVTDEELEARVLAVIDRLLENTRFANFPLLPSYWMSASVQNWSEGALGTAVFFALVMLSNVLFFGSLACGRLGGAFYEAANRVSSRGSIFARWQWFQARASRVDRAQAGSLLLAPRDWLDTLLGIGGLLRPDTRALVAKDMRMFWRDTSQWAQTAMLFGLLGVYIINLRHFTRQLDSAFWLSLVSFLNMGACALNLATLTTRFVFPQFSLEGRRVWLVGLAPIGLVRVVRLKFWLASVTTLAVTLGLVLLSCSMLGLDAAHTVFFGLSVTVMTFTLNAIAVGLGALYPNLRETNPNKIVSGFGGTFCLVLSFVYILVSVVLLAVSSPWGWKPDMTDQFAPARAASTWVAFVLVSFLAGWFPLRLGLRKVATAEL
jgi:ABC-2 type transport system permease protein